jgi:hypothetical protein
MSVSSLRSLPILVALAVLTTASPPALGAPAQRTFVKSTGVDNPACSLVAPCRSFAAAMLQTLTGGEVIVLDSAGYGTVTIAQSVSIIAPPGVYAGISVSSGDGITVNGAGVVVVLQGLSINGIGGANGISFTQGAELYVVSCSIANMSSVGISATAAGGKLFVSDTTVRDSASHGIFVSGTMNVIVDRARIENNVSTGVRAVDGPALSVRESTVVNNLAGVVGSASTGTTTRSTIDNSLFTDHFGGAAVATATDAGSLATLDMIRSTSTRSTDGVGVLSNATAPAVAVMTVAASVLTENFGQAVVAQGNATALANGNTIAGNASGGLRGNLGAVVHTRSNNSGEQTLQTSGTVTAVPGF